MKPCRTCKFCVPDEQDENTGWCHRAVPTFIPPMGSSWPPINLDRGWCGEHKPKPKKGATR